jgi:hypothetical protein
MKLGLTAPLIGNGELFIAGEFFSTVNYKLYAEELASSEETAAEGVTSRFIGILLLQGINGEIERLKTAILKPDEISLRISNNRSIPVYLSQPFARSALFDIYTL